MNPGAEATPRVDRGVAIVTGLGAALLYGLTTGALTFWLDSAEFVGVGRLAGIAHPPGSPLYTAFSGLATLLPLGSIPFRMHLFSGFFGALSASLLYLIGVELLERMGKRECGFRVLAVAVAWVVALSPALWFQSIRAEVYTLTSAINLALVYLSLRWQREPERVGAGMVMGLLGGLGLANHHFLTGLTGLVCLVYLMTCAETRKHLLSRQILWMVLFGVAGMMTYLYLPIRAHQGWLWWGDPASARGLVGMVSAEAFQQAVTEMPKAPFGEAAITILVKWVDLLGVPVFLLGFSGLIALLLTLRREGLFLFLLIAAGVVSKAIMYLDVENPDDHAYFSVGLQGLALCSLGWVSVLDAVASRMGGRSWARVAGGVVLLAGLGGSGGTLFASGMAQGTLTQFVGPDVMNRHMLGSVEPGAVYMPSYYATYFNTFYYHEVEQRRPDVALLQAGFQSKYDGGRPYAQDVVARYPELEPVMSQFLNTELFPVEALSELSGQRAVVLEANVLKVTARRYEEYSLGDLGLPIGNERLTFVGPGVELSPAAADSSWELAVQKRYWVSLYKELSDTSIHPELKKTLAWIHYRNALYFINRGAWINAHLEITMAMRMYPEMERFQKLEALLRVDADVAKSATPGRKCQSMDPEIPEGELGVVELELLGDEGSAGKCAP